MHVIDLFFKNNNNRKKKLAISSPRMRSYWNDEMMDKMDFTTILVYSVSLQFICFIYFSFLSFFFAADNTIQLVLTFPIRARKCQVAVCFYTERLIYPNMLPSTNNRTWKPVLKPGSIHFWQISAFGGTSYRDCLSG